MANKIIHTKKHQREILKRIDSGEKIIKISRDTGIACFTLRIWRKDGLIYNDGNENWHCPHCNKEYTHLQNLKHHIYICSRNPNKRVFYSPPHKQTDETKKKISEARKKYIRENPEKHLFLHLKLGNLIQKNILQKFSKTLV